MSSQIREVSLQEETEKRYLNYALSVITSRALPDVRDGLKPVQRRILYAMYHHLKLLPSAKYRKSAAVTGEVMGKYHPHGDQAIYDAMVRMAQSFSLLHPLVEGYGNFGSIDGDKAAAYRYTEARLQPISLEMLEELKQQTVDMRPNFDGTLEEPVVLPSKFPHLLVNGSSGIAVGMATNIPPHNLGEVMDAMLLVLDQPDATITDIIKRMKGPDFPTGGEIIASRKERQDIYQKGQGNLIVRGEWKEERQRGSNKKGKRLVIYSTPYTVNRSTIVEKIADVIVSKKLSPLLDVRDESTEQTRIVLELKAKADADQVMAYLYKHTPLQSRFSVNLTCLVPTPNPLVAAPERLSLKQILEQFLAFRLEVLERRFRYELERIMSRIHILEGFRIVFNALDEAIKIIRQSDGRKDSHEKLKVRFSLSDKQTEAILDTRLYRLAKLEIKVILEELAKLQSRADEIEAILGDRRLLKNVLREECSEFRNQFAVPRATRIREADKAPELDEEALIQSEDTHVILTRDGWVKRIKTINDVNKIRVREGDEVLAIMPGNTREMVCFLTNYGMAYTSRINDIKPTTGYGEPLQNSFKFKDGERVVGGLSFDPRHCGDIGFTPPELEPDKGKETFSPEAAARAVELSLSGGAAIPAGKDGAASTEDPGIPPNHLLVVTQGGQGSRVSLAAYCEPSTKAGRRFTRLNKGDVVLSAMLVNGKENLVLATEKLRYLLFPVGDVKFLGNPGKGVGLMKLDDNDSIFAAGLSTSSTTGLEIETVDDDVVMISPSSTKGIAKRLTKGTRKRGVKGWKRMIPPPLLPTPEPNNAPQTATPEADIPFDEAEGHGEDAQGTLELPWNQSS